MSAVEVVLVSESQADDLGLLTLQDVAVAASGYDYRVIGGHMVRLLARVYELPVEDRLTADADAGIAEDVAIGGELHEQLTKVGGYTAESGNRYVRSEDELQLEGNDTPRRVVDLLVPAGGEPGRRVLGARGFDGAPGLRRALAQEPVAVSVQARLLSGPEIAFTVPVPDVEAAFVLKMLAWGARYADKDVLDLAVLLEIVHSEPHYLARPWTLHEAAAPIGELGDAVRTARLLCQGPQSRRVPARLRALMAAHITSLSTDGRA